MKVPRFGPNKRRDADLDDEIRAHFDMAVRDRVARGESPEAARHAVRREFGNVGHVKEVTREMWGGLWLDRLLQDLRYAFRSLRRTPAFTVVAVLTLGLGIGANTVMFSVMNGVLFRPLPFHEPGSLFAPSYRLPPSVFMPYPGMYDRHYVSFASDTTIFEAMATFASRSLTLTGAGDPAKLKTAMVTPTLFPVLGVYPAMGRAFSAGEGEPGQDDVAILSDGLWRSRFGSDPRIVGKPITLEGRRRTVVGVMPASFDYPATSDVWVPFKVVPQPGNVSFRPVVARLEPGVTLERARQVFAARAAQFDLPPGMTRTEFTADVIPLKDVVVGTAQGPLFVFGGAVVLVLLIACANVANLLLMRVTSRDREIAVRGALGAGRWRLVRQLLTEAFALSAMGAVLGVLFAVGGLRLLLSLAPDQTLPRTDSVRLDLTALAFTLGLSLVTAIVCGLVPSMHATEERLRVSLAAGSRTLVGAHARLRSLLVVGEIALALVLLVGACLLLRSFDRMHSVDLGFDPRQVVASTIDLPANVYRTPQDIHAFDRRVLANLRVIPGVESAGAVNWAPLDRALVSGDFYLENGRTVRGATFAARMSVSPGYFRTLGLRLWAGRDFTDADRVDAPRVVVVSRSIADRLWPKGDAIGQRISFDEKAPQSWATIVGVVSDVVQSDVKDVAGPGLYVPLDQTGVTFFLQHVTFAARHSGSASAVAAAMRQVLRDADPALAVGLVSTMGDRVASTTLQPRFQSRLLLTFSLIALALAVIGIYGVLAYGVAQRMHEIGVRMALGASPAEVMSNVLRRTLTLVIPGVLLGLAVSFGVTRVLGKFLFQVTATDPATFASVGVLLGVVALAAAYIPARRASRVDPVVALRPD